MVTKQAKLWWISNGANAGGCLLTLGVTALILLFVLIVLWPFGNSTSASGQVTGFGMRETEQGSYRAAYVMADGVRGRVRLYPTDKCAVGDIVDVRLVSRPWGKRLVRGRASRLCPS